MQYIQPTYSALCSEPSQQSKSKFDYAGIKALIVCLVSSIRRAQMLGVQDNAA